MKKWITFMSIFALALVITACGANSGKGSSNGESAGSNKEETIEAGASATSEIVITAKNWEFDQTEYKIKAGETVDLTLKSVGSIHAVRIAKTNYNIADKKTVSVKFDKPGTYDMICSVPCGTGHSLMKAKLIVE